MGKRGPRAKPLELVKLEGNPGKRGLPKAAPMADGRRPRKPTNWRKGTQASLMWDKLLEDLEALGTLSSTDREMLVRYCETWELYCEARREVKAEGPTVAGRDGGTVRNPSVLVMSSAHKDLLAMEREMGKTPAARRDVEGTGEVDDERATALMSG